MFTGSVTASAAEEALHRRRDKHGKPDEVHLVPAQEAARFPERPPHRGLAKGRPPSPPPARSARLPEKSLLNKPLVFAPDLVICCWLPQIATRIHSRSAIEDQKIRLDQPAEFS